MNRIYRILSILCILSSVMFLSSCATQPRTYAPPDATKLRQSTTRVSQAVDAAHTSARKAQGSVNEAATLAKRNRAAVSKLKDVPPEVLSGLAEQETKLAEVQQQQVELDRHLAEADAAKAQVEKDKADYFGQAQKLADAATNERNARIKAEKALSWYRWHSWMLKIVGALAVVGIGVLVFLWFTGRLAGLASKFL